MTFQDPKTNTNPIDPNASAPSPTDPGAEPSLTPTDAQGTPNETSTTPSPIQDTTIPSAPSATPGPILPEDLTKKEEVTPTQIGSDVIQKAEDSSMISPSGDLSQTGGSSPTSGAQVIPEGVNTDVTAPGATSGTIGSVTPGQVDEKKDDVASPVEAPAAPDPNMPKAPVL